MLLADRGALRPGLTVEDASDLALLISSAKNYMVATGSFGWTPERWERTTAMLLTRGLLDEPPGQSTRST